MTVRCCIPFAVLLLAVAQPSEKDNSKKDREKIQGQWAVVSWEGKSFSLDKEKAKNSNVVIKDDAWQPTVDGKKVIKLTAKLDPSKTPKAIDLTLTEKFAGVAPPNFTMKGIYKIEGDTLTVCRTTKPDVDRPNEFKVGDNWVLIVLKRAEKK
jgi:uncharacterized protein (TIGR03067 family)